MIYYGLGIVLFLGGLLDFFNISKKYKININKFCLFILILFASLRWKTGTDWNSYYEYFIFNKTYSEFLNNHHNFEKIFTMITFFIRSFTKNYNLYLLIYITIGIILFYKILKKMNIKYMGVSIFSYYMGPYMDYFGGIRAAMAVLITLYSVDYIKKRNYKYFLFTNLIAMQFHRTAIVFLGAIFSKKIKMKRYSYLLIIIVFYFLGKEEVCLYLLKGLYEIFKGSEIFIFNKLEFYLNNNALIISESYIMKDMLSALKRVILLFIFIYYKNKIKINKEEYEIFFNIYFISICIYFLFSTPSLEIFKRMSIYFFSSEILLISFLLENVKNKTNKIVIYILFAIVYFSKLNQFLGSVYGELYQPYYDIFINVGDRITW